MAKGICLIWRRGFVWYDEGDLFDMTKRICLIWRKGFVWYDEGDLYDMTKVICLIWRRGFVWYDEGDLWTSELWLLNLKLLSSRELIRVRFDYRLRALVADMTLSLRPPPTDDVAGKPRSPESLLLLLLFVTFGYFFVIFCYFWILFCYFWLLLLLLGSFVTFGLLCGQSRNSK